MKSAAFANDILRLIFYGEPIAGIAENSGVPLASLYVSLHSARPSLGQNDNEAKYSRQRLTRSAIAWAITGSTCENAAAVEFGEGDGGLITHIGIGTQAQGAGRLLYAGAIMPAARVAVGHLPRFAAGEILITEETIK